MRSSASDERCPLTGLSSSARVSDDIVEGVKYRQFEDEKLGVWRASHMLLQSNFCEAKEFAKARALAASKVYWSKVFGSDRPFFVTPSERNSSVSVLDAMDDPLVKGLGWLIQTGDEIAFEARQLTYDLKAMRTLQVLHKLEENTGSWLKCPIDLENYPGIATFDANLGIPPVGAAFACVANDIPVIFHLLKERDLIRPGTKSSKGTIHITPKGYTLAEQLSMTSDPIRGKAFLICRFGDKSKPKSEKYDRIYNEVYKSVCKLPEIDHEVYRAKDIHHSDKIDYRIVYEIRTSAFIIVDITDSNFNVGFEAGLASAFEKPIIWCCSTEDENKETWSATFDIHSQNITLYSDDQMDKFKKDLENRVLAVLQRRLNPLWPPPAAGRD